MSLRQLLNFVFTWARDYIDPEKVQEWQDELHSPYWERQGAAPQISASSAEDEKAVFRAAMG